MERKAYAKINLSLDVIGKRKDGYHDLKMIMQSIDLYDTIRLEIRESGIEIISDAEFIPLNDTNIAWKAAETFFKATGLKGGCTIKIEKNIPVAAGLAGGSTDRACVLRMLNEYYNEPLKREELIDAAKAIGADVPFCLYGGTAICEGVGEKITQLPDFEGHRVVLIKPPFGVSTKEVFQKFNLERTKIHPETEVMIEKIKENDLEGSAELLKNVLENVTANKHKVIKRIKEDFVKNGALGSLMSGSGPSVYGLFDDEKAAQNTVRFFSSKYRQIFNIKTIGRY